LAERQQNNVKIKRDMNRPLLINYLFLACLAYVFGYQEGEKYLSDDIKSTI
jgi:hypothetical protein